MGASDKHNELASAYVHQVGRAATSEAELCVVLESIIVGSMQIIQHVYRKSPAVASGMVETAVQQAIERHAALSRKDPSQ